MYEKRISIVQNKSLNNIVYIFKKQVSQKCRCLGDKYIHVQPYSHFYKIWVYTLSLYGRLNAQ